ncbi:SPFH domain-containing protein [Altererythrobacter buctensis]|uniref:SPFH domain-containing protein n=2 Tax=Alteraurantiacibacter buctensis TaxID=1503981 RepID=A0A844YTZ9_9SPHN|nr:SPFH domain-containing protein [Alteraurantiacibacter buctensis]
MTISKERPAATYNGYLLLLAALVLAGWVISRFISFAASGPSLLGVISLPVSALLLLLIAFGFFMIQPNQGRVITLFGEYCGTERQAGLRWVWPWMGKTRVSLRANNIHSERVKINDLRGNPVEIACNVVWRVADTAQAVFDVDDYRSFVNIQIEAALRTVGARHPYDDMSEEDETTLRGSADVINAELQAELNDRLKVAGIVVDEAGLTHLAYAPEIAGAMLRRQQAEAVIAARRKLVEGAVTMVEMALNQLSAKDVVHLDDERRAAMVSNLMVVLCGERDTQPVVNAGSLYQ